MARSTVSQTIYARFIESVAADDKIPKEVAEKIKQLYETSLLGNSESISALLDEVEKTWRSSSH